MKINIFLRTVTQTFLTLIKIIVLSKFLKSFKSPEKQDKPCVIIGNGPSLNHFLSHHFSFLANKKKLCVNYFARTPQYEKVKPDYYLIASPEYWKGEQKAGWTEERIDVFIQIAKKTNWDLTILVPMLARSSKIAWRKELDANPKIKIEFFNNTPIEGIEKINHSLINLKLGMPRPHNVLVASLCTCLQLNFKEIYITGADHSWLEEIYVMEDNQVLLSQKHFYDEQAKKEAFKVSSADKKPMYLGGSKNTRKLHEVLEKFYYTFRSYWELKVYANTKKATVYNLSHNSYIDAFNKVNLDEQ